MSKRIRLNSGKKKRKFNGKGLKANALLLTWDMIEEFSEHAENGVPFDTICDLLQISRRSGFRWKARGELYEEKEGNPKDDIIYAAFLQRYRQANAKYFKKLIKDLNSTSKSAKYAGMLFRRAITILERRDRGNWGRTDLGQGAHEDQDPDLKYL